MRSGRTAGETDDTSTRMTGQCLPRLSSAAEHHVHHSGRNTYVDKYALVLVFVLLLNVISFQKLVSMRLSDYSRSTWLDRGLSSAY